MKLPRDRAQVDVCACKHVGSGEGGVVHVPPFDFVGVVGEEGVVLGFVIAGGAIPGVGEHVEVAAEGFGF